MCSSSTLFLCLRETFLFDGINDCEIHTPDYTVIRCDRFSRDGGSVCIYLRNSISFKTCLQFSNSISDLLILSLQNPSLIIIIVYRPPSCPVNYFKEISLKFIHMLCHFPPPNIILLGDFNLPEINWSSLNPSCPTAGSLFNLTSHTFLNQKVSEPIWNCNILDFIFVQTI